MISILSERIAGVYAGPLHLFGKFAVQSRQIVEQPALEAPVPGGMSEDERALLVDMLETSRSRLYAVLRDAPDELWHRKPAGGGWSAAECAEHLVLTEQFLPGIIRGVILAAAENAGAAARLKVAYSIVAPAMQDRSVKLKTLPCLEPQGRWARADARDAFLARRAVTLDYARTTRDALHHHVARIGELGLRDAYQWLLLLAAHTDRHVAQMQEALSAA